MSREYDFLDLLIETGKERERIFENLDSVLKKIRDIVLKWDGEAKVIHFGSSNVGVLTPESDIDILIVTKYAELRSFIYKLKSEIYSEVGGEGILELHIVTPEIYKDWYKRFIGDKYRLID